MKNMFLTVCLTVFLLANPIKGAFGHSNIHSMQSIEGDKIMIVYYSLEKFQSGVQNDFSLVAYQIQDGRSLEYDKIQVQFRGDSGILEKRVYQRKGNENPAFSFTFPKSGKYTMEVEVLNKQYLVIESSFPVIVDAGINQSNLESLIQRKLTILLLLGLIILAFAAGKYNVDKKIIGLIKKRLSEPFIP